MRAWKEADLERSAEGDRVVEFCTLKHDMSEAARVQARGDKTVTWSCEQWAIWFIEQFKLSRCEVLDDGENGALVHA